MAQGFYNDPAWAAGFQNLAGALGLDPRARANAALIGTQMDENRAQAALAASRGGQIEDQRRALAGLDFTPAITQGPDGNPIISPAALGRIFNSYAGGVGDVSQLAKVLLPMSATTNPSGDVVGNRFLGMTLAGHPINENTAVTPAQQESIAARNAANEQAKANSVANINAKAALDRLLATPIQTGAGGTTTIPARAGQPERVIIGLPTQATVTGAGLLDALNTGGDRALMERAAAYKGQLPFEKLGEGQQLFGLDANGKPISVANVPRSSKGNIEGTEEIETITDDSGKVTGTKRVLKRPFVPPKPQPSPAYNERMKAGQDTSAAVTAPQALTNIFTAPISQPVMTAPQAAPATNNWQSAVLIEAQNAIRMGADPVKVRARLQQQGINLQ